MAGGLAAGDGDVAVAAEAFRRLAESDLEGLLEHVTEDVLWRPAQVTEPYRGKDGVRRSMADWSEAWASFELELLDTIEGPPGCAVLVQRTRGTARGSGIEVEMDYYAVCHVRDGKVASMEQISDRTEAMAAAGVS